jgi:Uma2 family endonuclease
MSTLAKFTFEQYQRMVESGALDKRRLELIRGEIREMSPIGPEHEDVVDQLTDWSTREPVKEKVRLRVQNSIGLPGLETAPEPDIVWAARGRYRRARPAARDVLLLIEVADTSLDDDRGEKLSLYALAGIAEYWIVNLIDRCVEVYRDPEGGRYRSVRVCRGDEEVRPLALPEVVLLPSTLFDNGGSSCAG